MRVAADVGSRQSGTLVPFPSDKLDTLNHGILLRDNGISVSAAAADLGIPRSTLRDSLAAFDKVALPEPVKRAFITEEGQGFLKRICVGLHLCFRAGGGAGLRSICAFLEMTGLSEHIGASVGSQWVFGQKVDATIAEFGQAELLRMAPGTEGRRITVAADENFHEGPCLVALEPESGFLLCEAAAENRETKAWQEALAPILALLGVHVTQVVSDSGRSLIALSESVFGAHHSPDLFHILQDFTSSFGRPVRRIRRSLETDMAESEKEIETLKQMQARWAELEPSERGRGAPPQFERHIDEKEAEFDAQMARYRQLDERQREVDKALSALSDGYHPVSLTSGRRTGARSCCQLLVQVCQRARELMTDFSLGDEAESAVQKLERMGEKMVETIARISSLWHSSAVELARDAREAYVIESLLAPAAYLDRIAQRRGTLERHVLNKRAKRLRKQAAGTLGESRVAHFRESAERMAQEFQRSSSAVEGRNGVLSLRHHAFHKLPPQKRAVLTTLHNHVIRRSDGTTAAERLSGVPSRDIIAYLCIQIESFPRAGGTHKLRKAS